MESDVTDAAMEAWASRMHTAWRRQMLRANQGQRGKPRMRMREGQLVDVNQPWSKLHPAAQMDNRRAARAALEAVRKFPNDREAAAAHVHKLWIRRNKGDPHQSPALMAPYDKLPEEEKDKDRQHVDLMRALLSATPRGGGKSRSSTTPAGKVASREAVVKRARGRNNLAPRKLLDREEPTLHLTAGQWRQLLALAERMSQMQGRRVSPQVAGQKGLEAMFGLMETLGLGQQRK